MKSKIKNLKFEDVENCLRQDLYNGFCTTCKDWTRDYTEHDAENYKCPVCGNTTVQGALNLLLKYF